MKNRLAQFKHLDFVSKNILFFTLEGAVGAIILNMANPFFSMFARRMGASDYQIGMVNSLPALVSILALIPGSIIVDKAENKKKIVSFLILLFGIMYPLAALTPFLGRFKVTLFITVISLMNWPFSVFNISWQSYFSDVMETRSNLAFTKRTRAATVIGTITALAAGLLLSYIPKNDNQRIMMYQLFFVLSFLLAIVQSWLLRKVTSPASLKSSCSQSGNLTLIKECLSNLVTNREFRIFTILALIFHITWQMGWPLFFIYQVDVIHINEAWLSYVNVVVGISGFITYPFWGKAIEKKGVQPILVIGAFGLAANALTIILVRTKYMLLVQNTLTGLIFSAFTLAIFQNLLEVVPHKNKTMNIAVYTTLLNISLLISPMVGVWIYKQTSIVFALGLIGVLRIFATLLFAVKYFIDKKKKVKIKN